MKKIGDKISQVHNLAELEDCEKFQLFRLLEFIEFGGILQKQSLTVVVIPIFKCSRLGILRGFANEFEMNWLTDKRVDNGNKGNQLRFSVEADVKKMWELIKN